MKNFINRFMDIIKEKLHVRKIEASHKKIKQLNDYSLTKSRPLTLQENYIPLTNSLQAEQMFTRLKSFIYKESDKSRTQSTVSSQPKFIKESGKLQGNFSYFYLQPLNEKGWLFEQTSTGWNVSKAQKIVSTNTFQRDHSVWDVVTLHEPKTGTGTIRLTSERFQSELVNLTVYQDKLIKNLNID